MNESNIIKPEEKKLTIEELLKLFDESEVFIYDGVMSYLGNHDLETPVDHWRIEDSDSPDVETITIEADEIEKIRIKGNQVIITADNFDHEFSLYILQNVLATTVI